MSAMPRRIDVGHDPTPICGQPARRTGLRIAVYSPTQWQRVASVWSALARTSPNRSFFLSDAWVESWMEVFATRLDTSILVFETWQEPVAVCLLVKTRPRRAMIALRRISLNASGEAAADSTYIEFNNLLCRAGWEEEVAESLAGHLMGLDWDEFALDGFAPGAAYEALMRAFAKYELEEVRHPCYRVDLEQLRRSSTAYEMALGRTSRKHLRQNVRAYSEVGPLRLEPARDVKRALAMLEEMAELNRRRWSGRGRPVVFASPYFTAFHRTLIQKCFSQGSVQLLRLEAGGQTVGFVYNLVLDRKVYFYQCGFNYAGDTRLSPGTVTVSHAVQWCLEQGFDDYDFLSGETSYKRCLSTGSRSLVWAVFRKPGLRVRLMGLARAGKRWLAHRRLPHC